MTLEEVYQSMANLKYIVTTGQPELIVKEDIQNLIDYIENESIPKEKAKKLKNFYCEEAAKGLVLVPISNVIENINILLGE